MRPGLQYSPATSAGFSYLQNNFMRDSQAATSDAGESMSMCSVPLDMVSQSYASSMAKWTDNDTMSLSHISAAQSQSKDGVV